MLAASMVSNVGPQFRQRSAVKSSILVNCCGAQYIPVAWPPFTFSCLIGGPVLRLFPMCAPLSVPRRPPAEGPACIEKELYIGEPPKGSALSSCVAPIHFPQPTTAWFRASLHVHVPGPAAAVGDEEVSLSGELVRA
jgi:hypothetical protein